ncbi:ribonuclease HII [Litoreibacter roseus]|nr:ribonuclease HII [Litoreibacter roseus]
MKLYPNYSLEEQLQAKGSATVAGVDEVGRGPLAGPVMAAAAILDPARIPSGLNDSKKLSIARRIELEVEIKATAIWAIGVATVSEIDQLNIYHAAHLAMRRAVLALPAPPSHVLVDGNKCPVGLPCPATPIVKGDTKSQSIAAASILAKVARDRHMVDLAQQYPGYDWDRNAGYPTKRHISALSTLGVTPHHRVSFKPVHNILYQD